MMYEIRKLIATGQDQTILKNVYYDAAKSFAAEHGAEMSPYQNDPEDNCLFVELAIDGTMYSVSVQRWMSDETMLTVQTEQESREALIDTLGKDHFLSKLLNK